MEAEKGDDLWPAQPGFGGTALLYPVMLSEGVHKRGLSLDRVAQVVSAKPAQTFGLYGRKGTIAVGADADLVVVDMELEQTVTAELCQSAQDHCPFEGEVVKGWPVTTLVRGTPAYVDGKVSADFGGQYLKRG
jgi:dihydroorotase-like cyclic amidohydrolase